MFLIGKQKEYNENIRDKIKHMDQDLINTPDKPTRTKETKIHIIIMVLFIIAIGYLGYSLILGNHTVPDNPIDINIYFSNVDAQRVGENCTTVFPAVRTISKTDTLAETALEKLFEGTTTKEEGRGLHTDISPEFTIKNLTINKRVATVELHDDLELLGHSICEAATIKAQITKTLEQFSNINKVIITINDKTDGL